MSLARFPRALVTVLVLAALLLVPAVRADTGGPLLASVQGPDALAPGAPANYNLTISGGPSGSVNYSVSYYLTGTNTTGGAPLKASPHTETGKNGTFRLNVTAPSVEGTVTLVVTVSASAGGTVENTTASKQFTVIKPIALTATFHNSGNTAALNVTVRWYIDNALVGTTTLREVGPNADGTATFNYLPLGLSPGQHTVTVTADLDHDGVIDPSRGEVASSSIFYDQAPPLATGWILILGMGIFIPVFIGVVAFRRRRQR